MAKRSVSFREPAGMIAAPGLVGAPVLDLMCSQFVLTLASQQGARFNVRRDINGMMALTGRHLMWPEAVLVRVREFLVRRCRDNDSWRGHEQLSNAEFLERHGTWRGPYEEGTLFFYLDEYAKDAPKDLLAWSPAILISISNPGVRSSINDLRPYRTKIRFSPISGTTSATVPKAASPTADFRKSRIVAK